MPCNKDADTSNPEENLKVKWHFKDLSCRVENLSHGNNGGWFWDDSGVSPNSLLFVEKPCGKT